MDWIEEIFHVSPDGGSGLTELVILLSALLLVASLVLLFAIRRVRRRHRPAERRERTPPQR